MGVTFYPAGQSAALGLSGTQPKVLRLHPHWRQRGSAPFHQHERVLHAFGARTRQSRGIRPRGGLHTSLAASAILLSLAFSFMPLQFSLAWRCIS